MAQGKIRKCDEFSFITGFVFPDGGADQLCSVPTGLLPLHGMQVANKIGGKLVVNPSGLLHKLSK